MHCHTFMLSVLDVLASSRKLQLTKSIGKPHQTVNEGRCAWNTSFKVSKAIYESIMGTGWENKEDDEWQSKGMESISGWWFLAFVGLD